MGVLGHVHKVDKWWRGEKLIPRQMFRGRSFVSASVFRCRRTEAGLKTHSFLLSCANAFSHPEYAIYWSGSPDMKYTVLLVHIQHETGSVVRFFVSLKSSSFRLVGNRGVVWTERTNAVKPKMHLGIDVVCGVDMA